MRVLNVVPGSGGTFYCENCLRDSVSVQALRRRGLDAVIVPMYLPMYHDDPALTRDAPVFFGGINVYLQQRFRWFRSAPGWVRKALDSRWVLKLAARADGTTAPYGLGEMTLSMIRGEQGNQAGELERLVSWMASDVKPDVVHLSSIMLIGLAARVKSAVGCPVVCTLQDEDTWMDELDPPYDRRCWDEMRERSGIVDAFIAVSDHYGELMRGRLGLPAEKMRTVSIGMKIEDYPAATPDAAAPVMGYLSKLTPSLGLDRFVEAFVALKNRPGLERLRMKATGGLVGRDRAFVGRLKRRLARLGMAGDAEFIEEMDRDTRLGFLKSLSVLCVPMPQGEAFGTFMIEAWACGVPVVQPDAGAFPEIVGRTGGGIIYDPSDPAEPERSLETLLSDPARARELGMLGREGALRHFTTEKMAEELEAVYRDVTGGRGRAGGVG
ncbi:MAG: glycosyltransferase family 4 protein [Lentisphaerae bacterium]|nr:glycosyltransferase family 4 protein [Lentisphaerota bacterium]